MLADQRFPGEYPHHAWVGFGKGEQRLDQARRLAARVGFFFGNPVGEREDRALDEFDQAFVHLRFRREVAIQRSFRDIEALGQRRRGDLLPARRLEDPGQRLQDFEAALALLAFALLARHLRSRYSWTRRLYR